MDVLVYRAQCEDSLVERSVGLLRVERLIRSDEVDRTDDEFDAIFSLSTLFGAAGWSSLRMPITWSQRSRSDEEESVPPRKRQATGL
jgi:hypothetical protein